MKWERCHHGFRRTVLTAGFASLLLSCAPSNLEKYAFAYPAKSDHEETVYYSDEFFSRDSTEYRVDLATASMSFAMASFASGDSKNIQNLTRYNNIKNLLTATNFSDFQTNADYKKRSETDTIGLVFAHKLVNEKTLIYVGIRGANYEMEWASNLSIANPSDAYDPATSNPYHYGFHRAATQLIKELGEYITSVDIKGDIKLWTSGYSRAGATANIAGGLLDQAIEKGEKPLGSQVNLRKEDLYVYCFEPPMGAPVDADSDGKLLARGERYNNIFCHVNFNDPVPLVAMKEVGYTRFGIDRYFPDPISSLDGWSYLQKIEGIYVNLASVADRGTDFLLKTFEVYKTKGVHLVPDESASTWTQGLYVKELVTELTKFGLGANDFESMNTAKSNYFTKIQPAVRTIFTVLYESGAFKGSLIDVGTSMINDFLNVTEDADTLLRDITDIEQRKYFYDDLMYVVKKGLNKLGIEIETDSLRNALTMMVDIIAKFVAHVLGEMDYKQLITTLFHVSNIKSIGAGHYPELCLAAMRSFDKNYVFDPFVNQNPSGKHYTVTVYGQQADISVSSQGKEVLKVSSNGAVTATVPARFINSHTEFVLPYGPEYDISAPKDSPISINLFDYTYRSNIREYYPTYDANDILMIR